MKVILMRNVEKLGAAGDEVEVKDGHAMNYLIPRGLAMKATAGALRLLEQQKHKRQREEQRNGGDRHRQVCSDSGHGPDPLYRCHGARIG